MTIEILPGDVVDQIAAGEVLERPANLVKELIENSLDAGATEVRVEFGRGGRDVTVTDDGSGMGPEDLKRCLLRHATSKISRSSDLYRLSTYGFRGEALASIAGVSELSVVSRARGRDSGQRLVSKFGATSELATVSAQVGTKIEVRELFANVPARLEFLRSDAAEHGQIRNTLKAFALAREDVTFSAMMDGELILHWPRGVNFGRRVIDVLQMKPDAIYTAEATVNGVHVEVAVSSPLETQAVNRNLWFFVQGRWVQDRSLAAAVMEAYRNLLMHGEYPTVVVRLRLPPDAVDVNVHPTKSAVKFRDSQAVFRAVSGTIRGVLEKAPWLKSAAAPSAQAQVSRREEAPINLTFAAPEFAQVQYSAKVFPLAEVKQAVADYRVETPAQAARPFLWADLQVIGQAHLTYIVAQSGDDLYLVDQHAAHERVVFERLMSTFNSGRMDVQNLLLPLTLDLSEVDVENLLKRRADFEKLGLSLDRMGPESLVVQTLPSLVHESAVAEALRRAAHELAEGSESRALESLVGDIFATMACHSVVRAGQALSREQMDQLLTQMDEFPLSSFCPHGRPVFVRRRFVDIEREFGRIN